MTTSKRINVADLEFNSIKQNFIEFLKGQEEYQDYNFEGSSLSVLLDILAYNTYYNNLYTNFALNEVFIDSASSRDSVVSISKGLGYTPRSSVAAKALVTLIISDVNDVAPPSIILPSGTEFVTASGNSEFTFVTQQPYAAELQNDGYVFENVEIFEGSQLSNRYVVQDGARFIVPNTGLDLSTLKVKVQNSLTDTNFVTYKPVENFTQSMNDALVYYVKEVENGLYEVYFGEDIIGKQPEAGNVVILEYISCNGENVNGAKSFSYNGGIIAGGVATVNTVEIATAGKNPEDIESIRVNAPNTFSAQNRTVNTSDYKALIYNTLPNIDSVSVWGGEDNVPAVYGKVFVCVKPTGRNRLSSFEKARIQSLLAGKMIVAIIVEFTDPELLDIIVNTNVYYDPSKTNNTADEISLVVLNAISDYNVDNLNKFDGIYKQSKLSKLIDSAEKSIVSNITTIQLIKTIQPIINSKYKETIRLFNPIDSIESSEFIASGYEDAVRLKSFDDEIFLVTKDVNGDDVQQIKVGTLDKENGIIDIDNFTPTLIQSNNEIDITIIPTSFDVVSRLNQIASINLVKSSINMIVESKDNYIFTPSRN